MIYNFCKLYEKGLITYEEFVNSVKGNKIDYLDIIMCMKEFNKIIN